MQTELQIQTRRLRNDCNAGGRRGAECRTAYVVWWWGGVVDRRLKECVWKLLAGELSKCRVVEGEKNEWLSGGDEVNEGFLENVRRVKSGESNSERRFTAEAQIALVRFSTAAGKRLMIGIVYLGIRKRLSTVVGQEKRHSLIHPVLLAPLLLAKSLCTLACHCPAREPTSCVSACP